ncbi:hypothetical protein Tco_0256902 [Tanacetum coccineum]
MSNDQSFIVDWDVDGFLVTDNFGMILGQPVHTNDDVKTTKFNRHEVVSNVIGGILSMKARDMDTKLLSALESNNTLVRRVDLEGSNLHDKLPTLVVDSFTQGKVFSIPTIFSWGGSISPIGFLSSIMLLVVIIVAVFVIVVAVIVVVVVVGEGSSIIKLSFAIIGSLHKIVLCYLIH